MPKIFITGSGESRGYVTGSGIISEPPRYKIRKFDEFTGEYPKILRMNKKGNAGNDAVIFNDNDTMSFEETIEEDFKVRSGIIEPLNEKFWDFPAGIKIRKISDDPNDKDGAVEFVDTATVTTERYLTLKKKIRNPSVYFELFAGSFSLNSRESFDSQWELAGLKIQISEDGSTGWQDIEIKDRNVTNSHSLYNGTILPLNNQYGYKVSVKLDILDFNKLSGKEFYIRFLQEKFIQMASLNFALNKIKIISRNKSVQYPFLTPPNTVQYNRYKDELYADPNSITGMIVTASAHRSVVSNKFGPRISNQSISAFKDEPSFTNSSFYNEGIKQSIYPGFSRPLKNKTIFEVDLSPSEEAKFGMTNKLSEVYNSVQDDTSGAGQNLMVYWNNVDKKWEKIGKQLHMNTVPNSTDETMKTVLTTSCVGFGPTVNNVTTTGSLSSVLSLNDAYKVETFTKSGILKKSNKKITSFNFPYGLQYYATGSQLLKAKDIGITKPFLLEKSEIEFDAVFNIPASGSFLRQPREAFSIKFGRPSGNEMKTMFSNMYLVVPTFFMLRQFKNNYNYENIVEEIDSGSILSHRIIMPQTQSISPTSSDTTFVDESRDIITYGQLGLFLSGSNIEDEDEKNKFIYYNGKNLSMEDLNDQGLSFDTNVYSTFDAITGYALTQSFNLKFSTRINQKIKDPYSTLPYMKNDTTVPPTIKLLSLTNLETINNSSLSISRALFNGAGGYSSSETDVIARNDDGPIFPKQVVNVPDEKTYDESPYVIFPEDQLIFGWQYPLANDLLFKQPGSDCGDKHLNYMKLFGRSKLKLYGSQIVNGEEFHEGLNQNLTSNAIHEMIGSEPIIDQFQIATRGELTGSFITRTIYGQAYSPKIAKFGRNLFGKMVENFPQNLISVEGYVFDASQITPTGLAALIFRPYIKNTFFFDCIDMTRSFADGVFNTGRGAFNLLTSEGIFEGAFYDNSSYGTFGQRTNIDAGVSITGEKEYLNYRSKNVFNSKHYGYYSDMFKQSLDTKFTKDKFDLPSEPGSKILNVSPVSIKFVSSSYSDASYENRIFTLVDASLINGTSDQQFQSSNLSLNATSSIPFIDDGIVKNRTYGIESLILE